jgi:hypothetical protein
LCDSSHPTCTGGAAQWSSRPPADQKISGSSPARVLAFRSLCIAVLLFKLSMRCRCVKLLEIKCFLQKGLSDIDVATNAAKEFWTFELAKRTISRSVFQPYGTHFRTISSRYVIFSNDKLCCKVHLPFFSPRTKHTTETEFDRFRTKAVLTMPASRGVDTQANLIQLRLSA